MTGAIVAAAIVLVTVPALSWQVSGRQPFKQPKRSLDVYPSDLHPPLATIRRHGLQPAEVTRVERAAGAGRALRDERLRAAVVEVVEERFRVTGGRRLPSLWLLILFTALGAVVVGYAVALVSRGDWMHTHWFYLAFWAFYGVVGWRWQTAPRRALRLNSGPPSS